MVAITAYHHSDSEMHRQVLQVIMVTTFTNDIVVVLTIRKGKFIFPRELFPLKITSDLAPEFFAYDCQFRIYVGLAKRPLFIISVVIEIAFCIRLEPHKG